MVFVGWGFNGLILLVSILLVLYDEQAGRVIEFYAPSFDLRVAGVLAICASIVSISVRLYMMLVPPETVIIYWNLIYFAATILTAVLLISVAPDISASFQLNSEVIDGNGQSSLDASGFDPTFAALGLLGFMAFCVFRIEAVRAG